VFVQLFLELPKTHAIFRCRRLKCSESSMLIAHVLGQRRSAMLVRRSATTRGSTACTTWPWHPTNREGPHAEVRLKDRRAHPPDLKPRAAASTPVSGAQDWLTKSNVSLFEQTTKSMPNRVCAVPLWMFQVPRPDAQPLHDAREFCVKDRKQNQILGEIPDRHTSGISEEDSM
jgi:hypothetical protein